MLYQHRPAGTKGALVLGLSVRILERATTVVSQVISSEIVPDVGTKAEVSTRSLVSNLIQSRQVLTLDLEPF